jgi:hypothetical protein
MRYQILQPKKRSVVLSKGEHLKSKYETISQLQPVIAGQQLGMTQSIQKRYDSKTKSVFY